MLFQLGHAYYGGTWASSIPVDSFLTKIPISVQTLNNHIILTQNLYHRYCHPHTKSLTNDWVLGTWTLWVMAGYTQPLWFSDDMLYVSFQILEVTLFAPNVPQKLLEGPEKRGSQSVNTPSWLVDYETLMLFIVEDRRRGCRINPKRQTLNPKPPQNVAQYDVEA